MNLRHYVAGVLIGCLLALPATADTFTGTYRMEVTAGAIDGSTTDFVVEDTLDAFPPVSDMMADGFVTEDGKFAMQMFHFGSGWGFFDVSPEPSSFEVVENNGSTFGHNGWTIFSNDGKHATIIATWDEPPASLNYGCDDFCLVSRLGDPVGIVKDSDGDGVDDPDDNCPDTEEGAAVGEDGCSGAQAVALECPCDNDLIKNHGQFVACTAREVEAQVAAGLLTDEEGEEIVSGAAQSSCGKPKKQNAQPGKGGKGK